MLLDSSQSPATVLRRKNQKRIRKFLRKKKIKKFPTSGEPAQQEASGVGREEVNRSPLYTKQSIF